MATAVDDLFLPRTLDTNGTDVFGKMKKIKRLLTPLLMALVGWILCCPARSVIGAEVVDRIVAVVNEDIILLTELNQVARPYIQRIRNMNYSPEQENRMIFKVREDLIQQLVDQKLTDQEVERHKISISEKEIDNTIERFKQANHFTDERLRSELEKEGLSMTEYRERIKEQILRSRLVNRQVRSKIVITDADVRDYFERHPEKYGKTKRVYLRNLMMRIPAGADASQKEAAMERMNQILDKLRSGETFDKTGTAGRDLGFFDFAQLSPQLQEAMKDLKPGEYTPVLDTDQGLQIFYLQDIEVVPGKSLEEASDEIEQELYKEIVNEKFQSWLEDLRKRSHIKIIL
ncbi:MAG: SurA N-terminal domain-containing protein [Desulfobacteraceae bacterium]|nr:SurA N-terminal domain-containing protein [Desulfobacteraceae bacterium]